MSFDKTVVIVGPSASGKTGVTIEIALELERRAQEGRPLVGFSGASLIESSYSPRAPSVPSGQHSWPDLR